MHRKCAAELVKQEGEVLVGFGAAHQEQFASVGGGHAHIEQLDRGKFFEDGAASIQRSACAGVGAG